MRNKLTCKKNKEYGYYKTTTTLIKQKLNKQSINSTTKFKH